MKGGIRAGVLGAVVVVCRVGKIKNKERRRIEKRIEGGSIARQRVRMATGVRSFAKWLQLQAQLQQQYPQSLNGGRRSERPSRGWGAKNACAACGLWREKGKRVAREARGQPYLRARPAGGGHEWAAYTFVRAKGLRLGQRRRQHRPHGS